ncbi:hypothetical protein VV01_21305 [Luteipulveratus halotolerans]|uniref:Uncharacterized protein n=1 Tax=Luteipulveratus halotolerans TaxID=1631356 RepID=A0A0L6CD61_9MICO|nr:hypothetical protein VV01_21305 [Luteipulveratus halotolerans]
MGHRDDYLDSDEHWDPALSRDQRLGRWWSSASFGLALSGKAAHALAASEDAVAVAEAARDLVQHQAVYALLEEGHSVRAIAISCSSRRARSAGSPRH